MKCKYCHNLYNGCDTDDNNDQGECPKFMFNFDKWLKDNSKDYIIEIGYGEMFVATVRNKQGHYTVISGETLLRIAEKFNNQFKG